NTACSARTKDSAYVKLSQFHTPNGTPQTIFIPFDLMKLQFDGQPYDFTHSKDTTFVNFSPPNVTYSFYHIGLVKIGTSCTLKATDVSGPTIGLVLAETPTSSTKATSSSADTTSTGTTSTSPNVGLIAGISGGVPVVILACGGFLYKRTGTSPTVEDLPLTVGSTPKPQSESVAIDTETESPDAIVKPIVLHCVTAVPAFYCAVTDHEPTKEGQLRLTAGQRLYVTSVNEGGWCRALVGRDEGWVHANILGPIG
ncbi:UNVERIFIED_CONTAM: hypothetical protein HDU68_003935, partial [Siphonaria sp. JEL0065]